MEVAGNGLRLLSNCSVFVRKWREKTAVFDESIHIDLHKDATKTEVLQNAKRDINKTEVLENAFARCEPHRGGANLVLGDTGLCHPMSSTTPINLENFKK